MRPQPASLACEMLEPRVLLAAPFGVQGPHIKSKDFQVTTFATGLDFPVGLQPLSDGSYIVGESVPPAGAAGTFYNSSGELVRLVDNGSGVATASRTVLYSGLPGIIASVKTIGDLVFVTSAAFGNTDISILRTGATAASPLTLLGDINFVFPQNWMHLTYGLAVEPTPGSAAGSGSYRVFFNVGSEADSVTTPASDTIPIDGLIRGQVEPDSLYMVSVQETRRKPVLSNLTQLADGLRNAAGIAIQPGTGNLFFQDNGINGPDNPNPNIDPELGADTLDYIPARRIGTKFYDFGFANDYILQATGAATGTGAAAHVLAFLPINGSHAEGADDLAFSPTGFPSAVAGGIFVGFFGQTGYLTAGETANTENPVAFVNLGSSTTPASYFQFISNDLPTIGHPDGLLATSNSLFVSDLAPTDDFSSTGVNEGIVYKIRYAPPGSGSIASAASASETAAPTAPAFLPTPFAAGVTPFSTQNLFASPTDATWDQ